MSSAPPLVPSVAPTSYLKFYTSVMPQCLPFFPISLHHIINPHQLSYPSTFATVVASHIFNPGHQTREFPEGWHWQVMTQPRRVTWVAEPAYCCALISQLFGWRTRTGERRWKESHPNGPLAATPFSHTCLPPLGLAWVEEGTPALSLLSAYYQLGNIQERKSMSWSFWLFHSNLNILKCNLPAVQIPRPLK